MTHNTLVEAKTLKTKNQCIKYKGQNATFSEQLPFTKQTCIVLKDEKWQTKEVILIDDTEIIDDCSAPLFS